MRLGLIRVQFVNVTVALHTPFIAAVLRTLLLFFFLLFPGSDRPCFNSVFCETTICPRDDPS
jgi:hypothetical protein